MTVLSKIFTLTAIAFATASLSSCLNDSSSTSVSSDGNCAITRMTLGTIPRIVHTKTTAGNDTTYVTNVAGSAYAMYIDQINQEIYNHDSLPANTIASKIVFSNITSDGTVTYQNANGRDTLFSTSDTIDFTTPRYFTCFSTDGTQSRKYRVRVNIHNSNPDDYTWTAVAKIPEALNGISSQKMFVINNDITIVALKNGTPTLLKAPTQTPASLSATTITGISSFVPTEVFLFNNVLYYVDHGTLKSSTDGLVWQTVDTNISLNKLFAVSESEIFAIVGNKIFYSTDTKQWTEDNVADDMTLFPKSEIASTCGEMTFNNNFYSVMVCGKNASGESVVWKKIVDRKGVNTEPWTIYPQDPDNKNTYPNKSQATIFYYDSKIMHLGLTANGDASEITISTDGGRCWLPQASSQNPNLPGETISFSACCDTDNNIWITTAPDGTIVRGKLNRLSYAKDPTVFSKITK